MDASTLKAKMERDFWDTYSKNHERDDGISYPDNKKFLDARKEYRKGSEDDASLALDILNNTQGSGSSPHFLNLMGLCHQRLGNMKKALQLALKARYLAQIDFGLYHTNLAAIEVDNELYSDALKDALEGVRLNPAEPSGWINALAALDYLNDLQHQKEIFEEMKRAIPNWKEDESIMHHLENDSTLNSFRANVYHSRGSKKN